MLVVAPDGALEDRRVGDLPDFLRPGDALVVNDTRVIAARLDGVRVRGEAVAAYRGDADQAARREPLARARAPGQEAEGRRAHPLRRDAAKARPACSARSTPRSRRRARPARSRSRSRFTARRSTRRSSGSARRRCRPISPRAAPSATSDRADYQTMFAREAGAVAAPTAGLHFTPALLARIEAAGGDPASRDAACRRRHLPAGQGRRHARPRHARRMGPRRRDDRRGAQRGARARRADRRGRHAPRRACSKAPPTKTARIRPFEGETAIFITPGYRFRAVDALLTNFHLPRSTLFMLVARLQRSRDRCSAPTPTRSRRAIASIPTATPVCCWAPIDAGTFDSRSQACLGLECRAGEGALRLQAQGQMSDAFSFSVHAVDGAARMGAIATPRGVIRTPAFMPVGTAATVKAMYPERGARARRRHRARQHLSSDAAARRRARSPSSAACTGS